MGVIVLVNICPHDDLPCSRRFVCEITVNGNSDVCSRFVTSSCVSIIEFWR
jgi:hypothetical protein